MADHATYQRTAEAGEQIHVPEGEYPPPPDELREVSAGSSGQSRAERWARFAACASGHPDCATPAAAAKWADELLVEYDKRWHADQADAP
jgi:hypothetical protein